MADIAPALYEKIKSDFDRSMANDKELKSIAEKVEKGTATSRDTQIYSIRVGDHAANALSKNISSDVLPDGKMYYNIAERTVVPQLTTNYELVENVAEEIQKQVNERAGIGLNPVHVDVNQNRIDGIVEKITGAEKFDDVKWMLNEPVKNFTQNVADAFVQKNAEFQAKAGLSPKIKREVYGNCCDWCQNLAGTYDYGEEPPDFYRKHEYCRCLVIYDPGNGKKQNSHTKEWFESERDARIENARTLEKQQKTEAIERTTISERIKRGEYSLELSDQEYAKHIDGTPQYINAVQGRGRNQSKLSISKEEAQTIINECSGLGDPRITKSGDVTNVEYFTLNKTIGQYYDGEKWIDTKRVGIYHGKNGSHIVPVKEKDKE